MSKILAGCAAAVFCVLLAPPAGHTQGWNNYGAGNEQQPFGQQPYGQQPYGQQRIPNPGEQEFQQDMQALQRSGQSYEREQEERERPPMQIEIVPPHDPLE